MWIQSNCSSALTLLPLKSVTESFAKVIHGLKVGHLTDRVIQRSKRMVLDALGVGLLGTSTEVFHKTSGYSKVRSSMSTLELKPFPWPSPSPQLCSDLHSPGFNYPTCFSAFAWLSNAQDCVCRPWPCLFATKMMKIRTRHPAMLSQASLGNSSPLDRAFRTLLSVKNVVS